MHATSIAHHPLLQDLRVLKSSYFHEVWVLHTCSEGNMCPNSVVSEGSRLDAKVICHENFLNHLWSLRWKMQLGFVMKECSYWNYYLAKKTFPSASFTGYTLLRNAMQNEYEIMYETMCLWAKLNASFLRPNSIRGNGLIERTKKNSIEYYVIKTKFTLHYNNIIALWPKKNNIWMLWL